MVLPLPAGMEAKIEQQFQTETDGAEPQVRVGLTLPAELVWTDLPPNAEALTFQDFHVITADDIWAVAGAYIFHYNGTAWTESMYAGHPNRTLSGIHFAADGSVGYACGGFNRIYYYNGSSWSWVATLGVASAKDIWCTSDGAVAYCCGGGYLEIQRGTGATGWTVVHTAGSPTYGTCITGTSDSDVWVGGSSDTYHWDGATWTSEGSALVGSIWCIRQVGGATNTVWATGYRALAQDYGIMYYNGSAWAEVTSPNTSEGTKWEGISAYNEDNVYLCGTVAPANSARIIKWDPDTEDWSTVYTHDTATNFSDMQHLNALTIYASGTVLCYSGFESVDVDSLVEDVTITLDRGNPISPISLTFDNADGMFMAEDSLFLAPGVEINPEFRIGSSAWFPLGTYFLDRASFSPDSATVTVQGRNRIGRFLADQNNRKYFTGWSSIASYMELALDDIGFDYASYTDFEHDYDPVEENGIEISFPRTMTVWQMFQELFKARPTWRIMERYDGVIVAGDPTSHAAAFPAYSTYTFAREEEVFSRGIEVDDCDVYSKVCVYSDQGQHAEEAVANGDGVTTVFQLDNFPITPGTETIYINGEEVDPDDYTVDYELGTVTFDTAPAGITDITKSVTSYSIKVLEVSSTLAPYTWVLHGSNDRITWDVLDTQTAYPEGPPACGDWPSDEETFTVPVGNVAPYRFYSIDCEYTKNECADPGGGSIFLPLAIKYFEGVEDITPTMTGPESPEPYKVDAGVDGAQAWWVFDGQDSPYWGSGYMIPPMFQAWIVLDFGTVGSDIITASYTAEWYVYRDVTLDSAWDVPGYKTLFVQVPYNTANADAVALAEELALRCADNGTIETFVGPIRPQLLPGDGAQITSSEFPTGTLGVVTTVRHRLGRSGYVTEFVVDSGGRIGRTSLSRLIAEIALMKDPGVGERRYPG